MTRGRTDGSPGTSAGWYPVARADEVGTTPTPVGAGGRAYVLVRLRPRGEVSAFPARCPHRLVPLAAATVVEGRLRCPHHGWRFDGEGRCVDIPSMGPEGSPPPRADLAVPWAVEERAGWVWLAPDRTTVPCPRRPPAARVAEPVPPPPAPAGPLFGNLDPSLERAWHPVALSGELRPGGWLQVRLLGRTWRLRRDGRDVTADPPAFGVREHLGLIWLAPAEPVDVPLEVPEIGDRRFVTGWLPPARSPGPAAPLVDALLDAAHVPSVHPGSPGLPGGAPAGDHGFRYDDRHDDRYDVRHEAGGFSCVRERWSDDPTAPEADAGRRLLQRATYVFRAPFLLRLRVDHLDSGAATAVLFLLQPEDVDTTRIYSRLLLSAGPGEPLPAPAAVADAVATSTACRSRTVELQGRMASAGLPLDPRDELHVPADRLGTALRRALGDFAAADRAGAAA